LAAHTDLWLAQYTTGEPTWPSGTYPLWTLWQYSESGNVNGISGSVDLDRFNGPEEDLLKWISPAVPEMPTEVADALPSEPPKVRRRLPDLRSQKRQKGSQKSGRKGGRKGKK
jgi:hypothetical protein